MLGARLNPSSLLLRVFFFTFYFASNFTSSRWAHLSTSRVMFFFPFTASPNLRICRAWWWVVELSDLQRNDRIPSPQSRSTLETNEVFSERTVSLLWKELPSILTVSDFPHIDLNCSFTSAYVTYDDVCRIAAFQDQTVIAIRAPEETKLEVPTPTEVAS